MNPLTEPPSGEPRRLPGLYRRWELAEVLEQHGNCQVEDAGTHADGTPLVAVFFTESLPGSLGGNLTGASLNRLLHVPVGEIAVLPAAELASLQMKADASLRSARAVSDWISGALDIRYGARARQARAAEAKDAGTIRFEDNGYTVVADLPKRVKWDQQRLKDLADLIRSAWGEDPATYIKMKFEVSERAYDAWPPLLREMFTPARTVETGKASYKLEHVDGRWA
jgi:hypothetical protein